MVVSRPGELKGMDTSLGYSPVIATTNTNAGIFLVNGVREGSSSWARIGRKISMKSLRIRGTAALNIGPFATTADRFGNTLRMIVVYDSQPNSAAALPVFEDIFNNLNNAGGASPSVLAPLNFANTYRFRVLRDCMFTLNPDAVPAGGTENDTYMRVHFDEYVRMNLDTQFSRTQVPPTAMTITDISAGSLYVIFRAISNLPETFWAIDGVTHCRLRYSDE